MCVFVNLQTRALQSLSIVACCAVAVYIPCIYTFVTLHQGRLGEILSSCEFIDAGSMDCVTQVAHWWCDEDIVSEDICEFERCCVDHSFWTNQTKNKFVLIYNLISVNKCSAGGILFPSWSSGGRIELAGLGLGVVTWWCGGRGGAREGWAWWVQPWRCVVFLRNGIFVGVFRGGKGGEVQYIAPNPLRGSFLCVNVFFASETIKFILTKIIMFVTNSNDLSVDDQNWSNLFF